MAPPPVYTAQVIFHHISVFVFSNLYLGICNTKTVMVLQIHKYIKWHFGSAYCVNHHQNCIIITKQSRIGILEYKCLHSAKIGLAVQIKIYLFLFWPKLKFKLLPISDFLRRPKRSPALSQVKNVLAENMKMGRIVRWEKTPLKSWWKCWRQWYYWMIL